MNGVNTSARRMSALLRSRSRLNRNHCPPRSQDRTACPLHRQLPEVRAMKEMHIASWAELTEVLYAESWKEGLSRFRSDFAFRGLETPQDELRTGLMRLAGDRADDLEGHLLRNF